MFHAKHRRCKTLTSPVADICCGWPFVWSGVRGQKESACFRPQLCVVPKRTINIIVVCLLTMQQCDDDSDIYGDSKMPRTNEYSGCSQVNQDFSSTKQHLHTCPEYRSCTRRAFYVFEYVREQEEQSKSDALPPSSFAYTSYCNIFCIWSTRDILFSSFRIK